MSYSSFWRTTMVSAAPLKIGLLLNALGVTYFITQNINLQIKFRFVPSLWPETSARLWVRSERHRWGQCLYTEFRLSVELACDTRWGTRTAAFSSLRFPDGFALIARRCGLAACSTCAACAAGSPGEWVHAASPRQSHAVKSWRLRRMALRIDFSFLKTLKALSS